VTFPLRCAFLALLSWLPPVVAYAQPPATTSSPTDLDAFMGRVLERRDENWKKLHDYVLSETERFDILGPGEVKLHGMRREFTWYVRDGSLIRSAVRFDGVDIPEPERRRYEERWLKEEKSRESRRARKPGGQADEPAAAGAGGQGRERPSEGGAAGEAGPPDAASGSASLDAFVDQRGEPRFISEAYFLRFTFEPGNYYVVGREQVEGRDVVRIEYYPTRLFEPERERTGGQKPPRPERRDRGRAKERDTEREYERKFNKVALVTFGSGGVVIILIVREHPAAEELPAPAPLRPFRKAIGKALFLPILQYTDGYGFTYGLRTSFVNALGRDGRVSVPLTWGGTKRAAVELDKTTKAGPFTSLLGGASISRRTNPFYEQDDDRRQVWMGAARQLSGHLRVGLHGSFAGVTFRGLEDRVGIYGADLTLDTRNDPVFPRNAVLASAGWEVVDPRASGRVNRYHVEARGYAGLNRNTLTLALEAVADVGPDFRPAPRPDSRLTGNMTMRRVPFGGRPYRIEVRGGKLSATITLRAAGRNR
jgi:hypothetical protein